MCVRVNVGVYVCQCEWICVPVDMCASVHVCCWQEHQDGR